MIISKPSSNKSSIRLEEGFDLLDCYANFDSSQVYSEYIVKAMDKNNKPIKVKSVDQSISRPRPLEIITDSILTKEEAQQLADWEKNHRSSKAFDVSVTVQAWHHKGRPWKTNEVITLHSPSNRIYEHELLIKSVCFSFDGEGATTSLELSIPEGYSVKPDEKTRNSDNRLKKYKYI